MRVEWVVGRSAFLFKVWFHGGFCDSTVLRVVDSALVKCLQQRDNPVVQQCFKHAGDGCSSVDCWRCCARYVPRNVLTGGDDTAAVAAAAVKAAAAAAKAAVAAAKAAKASSAKAAAVWPSQCNGCACCLQHARKMLETV